MDDVPPVDGLAAADGSYLAETDLRAVVLVFAG